MKNIEMKIAFFITLRFTRNIQDIKGNLKPSLPLAVNVIKLR